MGKKTFVMQGFRKTILTAVNDRVMYIYIYIYGYNIYNDKHVGSFNTKCQQNNEGKDLDILHTILSAII